MNRATDLAVALAACLCDELTKAGRGLSFCGVLPGDAVVADYVGMGDDCGMAWVRMTTAYPASQVGVVNQSVNNCGTLLGLEFEIGVLRCFPAPPEYDGEPPALEDQLAAATEQHDDMLAMMRAVMCCTALGSKDYILGSYTPTGPMGLVYGGTWSLMVGI